MSKKTTTMSESLAILATEFKNHKENDEKWQQKQDEKIDQVLQKLNEGEGKIRDNREEINGHLNWHKSNVCRDEWSLKKACFAIAVLQIVIGLGIFIIQHIWR